MEYKVEYTPTEQDLKNLQIIKDFLEETNIPYIEDNEIFGLIHINDKTIQLRYINSFYHKIDLSHRFGDICKGIPKRYFIDISHENARNNIRTIWIFDFEMSQTNETPITLPNGEVREVMKFHPAIAPYKVAVLPLNKKFHSEKANEIYEMLSKHFMTSYDEGASIGKRYRRQDAIGTPFAVTVDDNTIQNDTVTVRDRDTMEQVTIPVSELVSYIEERIQF